MKNRFKKRKMDNKSTCSKSSKMLSSIEIDQIISYSKKGLGLRQISRHLGFSRNTIKKYLGLTEPLKPKERRKRESKLKEYEELIRPLFFSAEGNCEVVRQHLEQEHRLKVSARSLRRFCQSFRNQLAPKVSAGERYETAPGQQMQIDFGQKLVMIGTRKITVHFFVSILAYSRRIFVKAYTVENQSSWLDGIESAFHYYGGVPLAVLSDNSRCIIKSHRSGTKVELTARYEQFCHYWRVKPLAGSPYHPQGKGKCERAVRYVKSNALAARSFNSISELNEYLTTWCLTYSDQRELRSIFSGLKTPKERFWQEKAFLQDCRARTACLREEIRRVDSTGLIRVDNLFYRLSDEFINKDVQILADEQSITVSYKGQEIAKLDKTESVYRPEEQKLTIDVSPLAMSYPEYCCNELQRSMKDYEEMTGGNW